MAVALAPPPVDYAPGAYWRVPQWQQEEARVHLRDMLGLSKIPTEKQAILLTHPARRFVNPILFGGAKGGGKSAGIVMLAIKWGNLVPENRCLLCRDTYANFRISTLQELMAQLTPLSTDNGGPWRLWPGKSLAQHTRNGSEIWWTGVRGSSGGGAGGGKNIGSTQFGFIGIEEASDISREDFKELQQRLRHPQAAACNALQLALTANPYPTWIKEDWITACKPGYRFIRSLVRDNPHVYEGYEADLRQTLTADEVSAFVEGDWNALGPSDQAIPQRLILQAEHRTEQPDPADCVWGVDVARKGPDWCSVWQRAGKRWQLVDRWHGLTLMDSALHIDTLMAAASTPVNLTEVAPAGTFRPHTVNIDTGGFGIGLMENLRELAHAHKRLWTNVSLNECLGGGGAKDRLHYVNLNAELIFALRIVLEGGEGQIVPDGVDYDEEGKPHGPDLITTDLGAFRAYWTGQRRRVDSNEVIRGTIGRSPDDGNALLLTMHQGHRDQLARSADEQLLDNLPPEDRARAEQILEAQQQTDARNRAFFARHGVPYETPDAGDDYIDLPY